MFDDDLLSQAWRELCGDLGAAIAEAALLTLFVAGVCVVAFGLAAAGLAVRP